MNQQVRLSANKEWTAPFTADEFLHMLERGAFADMRAELVRGEIEKMMPADWAHGELVIRLSGLLFPLLQAAKTMAGADVVLRVDDHTVRAFDIAVVRPGVRPQKTLAPQDVLFGVEIAESTQRRDLGEKREESGGAGIPAYWVVDTVARVTHCFLLDASGTTYNDAVIVPFGQPMDVPGPGGQITID